MEEKKQNVQNHNPHSGHRRRLRETYIEQGPESIHDHQLLELLLTYAIPRQDTNPLAHRLLGKEGFGSLEALFAADVHEIAKVKGVGESAAILLSLIGSLNRRTAAQKVRGTRLNTPYAAMEYCKSLPFRGNNESMYIISLDKSYRVLHADRISSGTPGEVTMYPRTVVETVLRRGAEKVMLCHNHPSGDLRPSQEDLNTTSLIIGALTPIGIVLNDHIIVGGGCAYSMSQQMHELNSRSEDGLATAAEKEE
ncbi:MAG: RadC family protein [Christensenellales bacterium]